MNNATNAVVGGKMEPAGAAPITQQSVVTGQYLFDNFMAVSEEQVTRMNVIRGLALTAIDPLAIKAACDKMVELAVLIDYPTGKPKKAERGTKEQSAMNVRTIIQSAWGALRYATDVLETIGYTHATGYQEMRVLAKKALDTKKVDWKGAALLTDADKEANKLKKERADETKALVDVQKENPRGTHETLAEWQARTLELATDAMDTAREEALAKKVKSAVERLNKEFSENDLAVLIQALIDESPFDFSTQIVQKTDERTIEVPADAVVA